MKKLDIFFNSLEEREKIILFIGVLFTVLFIGVYITVNNLKSLEKTQTKLEKEIKNYNELLKLAGIYASKKDISTEKPNLNLATLDKISKMSGIKDKVLSIKPVNYEGKEVYEIQLEKVSPEELEKFISNIKKSKLNVYFITIDNIRQNNKLKVRITVGI